MITVLANGCFDILHIGHLEHLRQARAMGDRLFVALTADERVNKGPGRPINLWRDRAEMLREWRCVDVVIKSASAIDAIQLIKPDIFVKGIDYAGGKAWTEDVVALCERLGVQLRFTTSPKRSATDMIKRTMAL